METVRDNHPKIQNNKRNTDFPQYELWKNL